MEQEVVKMLLAACKRASIDNLHVLLEAYPMTGRSVSEGHIAVQSPVRSAVLKDSSEVLRLLVDAGKPYKTQNPNQTPFMLRYLSKSCRKHSDNAVLWKRNYHRIKN